MEGNTSRITTILHGTFPESQRMLQNGPNPAPPLTCPTKSSQNPKSIKPAEGLIATLAVAVRLISPTIQAFLLASFGWNLPKSPPLQPCILTGLFGSK